MGRKKLIADANELIESFDKNGSFSSVLIDDLNKNFGKVAYSLGEEDTPTDINELVSTGSTVLDSIISNDIPAKLGLKNGGLPVGRLVHIFGDNSTGKSLMANHILINTQRLGGIPVLFDEENATSIDFIQRMGMKLGKSAREAGLNNLVYTQAGSIEKVFAQIEHIVTKIRDNNIDKLVTIVVDSVASCPTDEEIEKGYDEKTMATKARLLSLGLRKIMPMIGKKKVLLIFVNQIRSKFGVMFGDPTTTPGGYSINFHSSVMIQLYKSGEIKDKDGNVVGTGVRAKVKKNRLSAPGRQCTFSVYFAHGIDDLESNFNLLVEKEIIRKPTTQSYELDYNGQPLKFKSTQWRETVLETPGLADYLKQLVMERNIIDLNDMDNIPTDDETGATKIEATNEVE